LQEKENLKPRIVNYILYGNGKPIKGISNTSIQLVRTCLVFNWNQDKKSSSIEEARVYFMVFILWSLSEEQKDGCRHLESGSDDLFNLMFLTFSTRK
jgi:hypothetical protein